MSRRARRTTPLGATVAAVIATLLASCSSAGERRGAAPADTVGAAAPSEAVATTRAATAATAGESATDSVRGVVERVGSDPSSQLVVRGADGGVCALHMPSPPSFEGLEVTLWGRRDLAPATMIPGVACAFTSTRYAVRAVDGIPAVDGTLRANGASYAIETTDGVRRPLRDVPPALRTQVGARIYWAGSLDRAPAAYGVLVAATP